MELKGCDELTESEFLEQYSTKDYPRPALTADIAVFRNVKSKNLGKTSYSDSINALSSSLELLLVRRGGHPYLGCWALPGGFVDPGETATQAAARELEEETGIAGVELEQLGIYSEPGRDPRGWTASEAYVAIMGEDVHPTAGDDANDARWFDISVRRAKDTLTLTAKNGDEVLSSEFTLVHQKFSTPRAKMVSAQGFAFDHAQMIAEAYLRISDMK